NQLTGTIPNLSTLTNLKWLYLSNNQLTGNIPDLSSTKLQMLTIAKNQLTGSIPELNNLTNLEILSLKYNNLSGTIPSLSSLTKLDKLWLEGNSLTGSIPDLSSLVSLTGMQLSANKLTGTIPDLSNLAIAHSIYLGDNQLTGNIPDLSGVPNLWNFSVANNKLNGEIPSLASLSKLETFQLTGNDFCKGTDVDYAGHPEVEEFPICGNPAITLTSPMHGAENIPISGQTFTWNPDSEASAHRIVISTLEDFSGFTDTFDGGDGMYCNNTTTCLTASNTGMQNYTVTLNLPENTTYYWKVRASRNPTLWSEIRSFTTGGLLGYWNFDNCDATDSSDNGFDGIFRGEPTCVDGVQGKALSFDGNDAIDVDGGNQLAGQNITLSAWVNITESTTGTIGIKYDEVGKNGYNYGLGFSTSSGDFRVGARTENAIDDKDLSLIYSIKPEELGWVHVAQVLTPNVMKLYFNGELKSTMNLPDGFIAYTGPQKFGIGGAPVDMGPSPTYYQAFFLNKAVIDELSVYSYAFSDAQIENLYSVNKPATTGCNGNTQLPDNLCDGLTLYMPFDGNAKDESGNGSDGVINGATLTTDRHGNTDSAYGFEDGYIEVPDNNGLDFTNEFTIGVWVNPEIQSDDIPTNGGIIISKEASYEFALTAGNNKIRYALKNSSSNWKWINTGIVAPLNQWTFLTMSYDGSLFKLYKDGILEYQNLESGNIFPTDAPLGVGARYGGPLIDFPSYWVSKFNGLIDDVSLYRRTLTDDEVQSLYDLNKQTTSGCNGNTQLPDNLCEGLVAYYP
ncbi:MAG: hypothetical protein IMF12_10650, partial [Proteobacteria bacterium]|nr:hypothetical protein [Pseudomonadota bacterium]